MKPDVHADKQGNHHRKMCYRCFRAAKVCICDRVVPIQNQTGVTILQHPREVRHPIGTARIVRLGMQNVSIHVAARSGDMCLDLTMPPKTALLYPRPDAVLLDELDAEQLPEHLIVLDGTWGNARTLYRCNSWLHSIPHVAIQPDSPSRYRIRKQPRQGFLSTLEAIIESLEIIEPELQGCDQLLSAFDAMVTEQVEYEQRARHAQSEAALGADSQ